MALLACSKDEGKIGPDLTTDGGKPIDPNDPNNPNKPLNPGADTHLSGTRLKRRVVKGSDGSQQFTGWFDSERNENCSFTTAADSKERCLPVSAYASASYFEDAGCTRPVFFQAKGCAAPKTVYFNANAAQACQAGNAARVLTVNGPFTGAAVFVGPACTSNTPTTSLAASFDLYSTGAEIPAGSFVEGTEERL